MTLVQKADPTQNSIERLTTILVLGQRLNRNKRLLSELLELFCTIIGNCRAKQDDPDNLF